MKPIKVRCAECGKMVYANHPYCAYCFSPVSQRLPDNTPYGVLSFIAIVFILVTAIIVGNVIYAIFK